MDWVEKHASMERGLSECWNLLCIEIEQALLSFRKAYTNELSVTANSKRMGDCLHVTYSPLSGSRGRAIDVCLDRANLRVFSRVEGKEKLWLSLGPDEEGKPILRDDEGVLITSERASEFFLRKFLFP